MTTPIALPSAQRRGPHRAAAAVFFAGVAAACLGSSPRLYASPQTSTTLTPASHGFIASLAAGTTADFTIGAIAVRCKNSKSNGQLPAEPDNHNANGPVTIPISPTTFTSNGGSCATNDPLVTATTTANEDNGPWRIALQYDPAGTVATIIIPQAGVVTTTSGLLSCRVTVAPDGPATLTGRFVGATSTNLPKLDFSAGISVPIRVTGGSGCPKNVTTASFRATYDVTDTTDPTKTISTGP